MGFEKNTVSYKLETAHPTVQTRGSWDMKIIILILNMIISTIGFAQCQITGIYSLDRFDENLECNIYFFKSGSYYIELSENVTSDIDEALVLSYGKFSLTNNEVTLIDKVHNYKMLLVVDNKTLRIKQAFNFLINKRFVFYNSITNSEPKFLSSNTDSLMLQEERKSYKKSHKTLVSLNFDVFENEQGFKLNILQNNKYKLEFKNIILSEGEWRRDSNELELKDLNLKHSFYVLIDDKVLISKLLPGEYKGCSLNKQK
jgi:hypothetical protein